MKILKCLLACTLSLLPASVLACFCDQRSLAAHYAAAKRVLIGQPTACVGSTPMGDGGCPTDRWEIAVIEALKGPSESPVTTSKTVCPFSFRTNKSYLIFLSKDQEVSACGGSEVLSDFPGARVNQWLQQLREYRDSVSDNLHPRWKLTEKEAACSLTHSTHVSSLNFVYRNSSFETPEMTVSGPGAVIIRPTRRDEDFNQVIMEAWVTNGQGQYRIPPEITIEVRGRSWQLDSKWLPLGSDEQSIRVPTSERLLGEAALEVMEALTGSVEYKLKATRRDGNQQAVPSFAGSPIPPIVGMKPMEAARRGQTTQFGRTEVRGYTFGFETLAREFLNCVERVSAGASDGTEG